VQGVAFGLGLARAHTAARSIGLARGALEDAIAYAKERVQFGQPISDFQAIRFKIATMATEVEAARQLMYYVCSEIDAGRAGRVETSMVKLFASEMAEKVTSEALQIFGGAGYTTLHADRALLARRAADQDLRGHLGDPASASSPTSPARQADDPTSPDRVELGLRAHRRLRPRRRRVPDAAAEGEEPVRSGDGGAGRQSGTARPPRHGRAEAGLRRRRRRPARDDRRAEGADAAPGAAFGGEPAQAVVPDVFVREGAQGLWLVELNTDTLPKLLVDHRYHARVSAGARTDQEKTFVSDCISSANWLVKSLDQRAKTILKVASEIVRQQDGFLAFGVEHLRPLNLKTVADAIGMHESTVSRVTSNKYLATPRGVFEMKFFFHLLDRLQLRRRGPLGRGGAPQDPPADRSRARRRRRALRRCDRRRPEGRRGRHRPAHGGEVP
jgi:hypothetical protein